MAEGQLLADSASGQLLADSASGQLLCKGAEITWATYLPCKINVVNWSDIQDVVMGWGQPWPGGVEPYWNWNDGYYYLNIAATNSYSILRFYIVGSGTYDHSITPAEELTPDNLYKRWHGVLDVTESNGFHFIFSYGSDAGFEP